jgi:polyhydroxyalkanoate synthesis regulator phasin
MTAVIRRKEWEVTKSERLMMVLQEIEFIQQEIHRLNKSIRGYEKEVRDLKAELAREVRS